MLDLLKVRIHFVFLPILVLRVLLEAGGVYLLMVDLRAIVEARIRYTQLVAHIIRHDLVGVLLAAGHPLDAPRPEPSCVLRLCIRCQLARYRSENLQIL